MNLMAIALFVMLFAFGKQFFGLHDSTGRLEVVLIASFVLGMISRGRS